MQRSNSTIPQALREYLNKNIGNYVTIQFPKSQFEGKLVEVRDQSVMIQWDSYPKDHWKEYPMNQVVVRSDGTERSTRRTRQRLPPSSPSSSEEDENENAELPAGAVVEVVIDLVVRTVS